MARIRTLCAECAEEVGTQFALRGMIRRDIKCSCERCHRRRDCRIYECERREESDSPERA